MDWMRHTATGLIASVSLAGLAAPAAALAATPAAQTYDLQPQDLGEALRKIALISGRQIVAASDLIAGQHSALVRGLFTPSQAYAQALSGSGLELTVVGDVTVITRRPVDLPPRPTPTGEHPPVASEVTVTGTRIRGQAPVGSNLIVIDRTAIDQSGYATTQDIIQAIPQNFGGGASESTQGVSFRNNADLNESFGTGVNLRGLGANSTLVLLNGQRPALDGVGGAFADISMVPSTIIQRVEVLADGASALYGSDAVAGVVNIIFRDNFQGAETSLHYGSADGFGETQLSQIVGVNWGSGHAVFAYEYYDHGALSAADRAYATEDLRPFGGPDLRSSFASPGTILAGGQTFAIPQGSTGIGLTPSQLLPGQVNLQDDQRAADILPAQQRHSFYGSLHQDLGWNTTFFAQGLFAERSFSARVLPQTETPLTVPTTNPFYVDPLGTRQPVQIEYNFDRDLGVQENRGIEQGYDATVGLDHRFGEWSATVSGSYGLQREYIAFDNVPNSATVANALADTNPATALNLFGSGANNNPATLNQIRGYDDSTSHSSLWSLSTKLDGPLLQLPAGALRIAVGAEYRVEHYDDVDKIFLDTLEPEVQPLMGVPGARKIAAAYGELLVPIIDSSMNVPGVHKLDLSLAGRIENYSDVGTTTNPKIGLGWSVVSGVNLRLAYGTSFRAPSFNDLRTGAGETIYAPLPLTDPKSPTGVTNALILIGNSPTLQPERATTWNAGVDFTPERWPGFKASLGYFDVDFRDRIAAPTGDILSILENRSTFSSVINTQPSPAAIAAFYASPFFENPDAIPASAVTTLIDNRVQNIARVHQDGFDFDAGYTHTFWKIASGVGVGGTYILHIDQAVSSTAPATDVVATLGEPVRLRLRGRATAAWGPYSAAAFVNFTGAYSNLTVTPAQPVSSWTTLDMQLTYTVPIQTGWLHGVKLALDASNLLNAAPPFVINANGVSAVGYDSDNASPVGRRVALQLTKAW